MTTLVETMTADGNSAALTLPNPTDVMLEHEYTMFVMGTWGTGSLTVEASPDLEESTRDRWVPITDIPAQTTDNVFNFRIRAPRIRVVLAGSTGADLDVYIDTAPNI